MRAEGAPVQPPMRAFGARCMERRCSPLQREVGPVSNTGPSLRILGADTLNCNIWCTICSREGLVYCRKRLFQAGKILVRTTEPDHYAGFRTLRTGIRLPHMPIRHGAFFHYVEPSRSTIWGLLGLKLPAPHAGGCKLANYRSAFVVFPTKAFIV